MEYESWDLDSFKSKGIAFTIWEILDSIKTKLFDYGFIVKPYCENYIINIDLDTTKINKNSKLIKNNITGLSIVVSPFSRLFESEINFIQNDIIIHELDANNPKKKIDVNFPIKDILKKIFKLICIDLFDRYENCSLSEIENIDVIIDNLKDHEHHKEYENRLRNLYSQKNIIEENMKWKKKIKIILKEKYEEFNQLIIKKKEIMKTLLNYEIEELYILNDIFTTKNKIIKLLRYISDDDIQNIPEIKNTYNNFLKAIDEIKDNSKFSVKDELEIKKEIKRLFYYAHNKINYIININETIDAKITKEIMKFEKNLFPEIFNLETKKSEISNNIDMYNKKYIEFAKYIKKYLSIYYKFESFNDEIKENLKFIINNFY